MLKKYFVFGTTRQKSNGISVIMCKKGTEDQNIYISIYKIGAINRTVNDGELDSG